MGRSWISKRLDVLFRQQTQGICWGIDESSAMVEADIAVGKVESGVVSVDDYWAFSFAQPALDTSLGDTKDIELISGSEENEVTTITFRRKLTASDDHDRAISKTSPTPIIFAWHSTSDELQYHTYESWLFFVLV